MTMLKAVVKYVIFNCCVKLATPVKITNAVASTEETPLCIIILLCVKTGAQMILAMKLISLAFDLDSGAVRDVPSLCHYGGYLFHVGSVLFGPWTSYHDYLSALNQPSERIFVSFYVYMFDSVYHWHVFCL